MFLLTKPREHVNVLKLCSEASTAKVYLCHTIGNSITNFRKERCSVFHPLSHPRWAREWSIHARLENVAEKNWT